MERPLYQRVALEQDSQDFGASPPSGAQAAQAIQDLPPTPAPSEPPAKPPPPATTQQLQVTLTDMRAASSQAPSTTPAEQHLRPAERPPPLLPGAVRRRLVADAWYKQTDVAPAARFPQPLAAITDAIAEPKRWSPDSEDD